MFRVDPTPSTWTNWAATASSTPVAVAHPRSTEEIVEVIVSAGERGLRVKAVGSGHSFTAIAITDGVLIELDRLIGLVHSDLATGLVTVRSGTPLHLLNALLAERGLAMANLGDIDRQTISGALATGTHGTGARFQGLAAAVSAMRIVLADGSIVDCDNQRDPELFEAARIGLGAMGVISELTLQCVPAFLLNAREDPSTLTATLAQLDDLVDGTDHVEFYWFPHTDNVLLKQSTRLPPDGPQSALPRWRSWLDDDLLSNRVFEGVNRICASRPSWVPRINAVTSRVMSSREFTLPSYRVFASRREVRFREMEYAVPRERIVHVLGSLKSMTDRGGHRVSFPVEVRFAAADDMWLSTATGRDSAYVAVHQYHRMDHRRYFDEFEAIARDAGGRPHWGKLHGRARDDLRPYYPHFDDVLAVRDRVDPERRFGNDYLTRVLGA